MLDLHPLHSRQSYAISCHRTILSNGVRWCFLSNLNPPHLLSGALCLPEYECRIGVCAIPENTYTGNLRNNLLEQLQSLTGHVRCHQAQAGHIPTRLRETRNKLGPNRIASSSYDDGDCCRCSFGRKWSERSTSHNNVNVETHEFFRKFG